MDSVIEEVKIFSEKNKFESHKLNSYVQNMFFKNRIITTLLIHSGNMLLVFYLIWIYSFK